MSYVLPSYVRAKELVRGDAIMYRNFWATIKRIEEIGGGTTPFPTQMAIAFEHLSGMDFNGAILSRETPVVVLREQSDD